LACIRFLPCFVGPCRWSKSSSHPSDTLIVPTSRYVSSASIISFVMMRLGLSLGSQLWSSSPIHLTLVKISHTSRDFAARAK
jgi:hypothetical protein